MVLDIVAWAAANVDIVVWLKDKVSISVNHETVLDLECVETAESVCSLSGMRILETTAYVHLHCRC